MLRRLTTLCQAKSLLLRRIGDRANITAAACVIGDEVLNGKTQDSNANYLAKWCFQRGIELRRVVVIPDDPDDIKETVLDLAKRVDLVYTSGGIGPTHDDITYASIASAYNLPLAYHQETLDRMRKALRSFSNVPPNASTIRNRERMALLPTGNEVKVHYADNADIWTPVVIIREQVHILPGVPTLFKCLLDSLPIPQRLIDMHHQTAMHPFCRILIGTHLNESSIADILCAEQAQVQGSIKIGSYPCWKKDPTGGPVSVVVSVVGRDRLAVDACAKRLLPLLQGQLLEDH